MNATRVVSKTVSVPDSCADAGPGDVLLHLSSEQWSYLDVVLRAFIDAHPGSNAAVFAADLSAGVLWKQARFGGGTSIRQCMSLNCGV